MRHRGPPPKPSPPRWRRRSEHRDQPHLGTRNSVDLRVCRLARMPCRSISYVPRGRWVTASPKRSPVQHDVLVASHGSLWSYRSQDSILSIGSRGSVLSIGSVGSVLSIGSIGSACSVLSIGSFASAASVLSSLADRSLMS